jgi:transcriptional regulator with XRE-family HTH domain
MILSTDKTPAMIFSANLRRLMERDRVKQKDLVKALHVVQGAVSAWVNGQTPDFPNQQKLAKYFDVTVAELFTERLDDGGKGELPADEKERGRKKRESAEVMELREQFDDLIARAPEVVAALKPILSYLGEGKKRKKK